MKNILLSLYFCIIVLLLRSKITKIYSLIKCESIGNRRCNCHWLACTVQKDMGSFLSWNVCYSAELVIEYVGIAYRTESADMVKVETVEAKMSWDSRACQ